MTEKDLFLNWKGLEWISNLKWILIILSVIFIVISIKISNVYIAIISLLIIFLQYLSDNKEYYLKYKEIFEEVNSNHHRIENYRDWINFLDKTKGLKSFSKKIVEAFCKKELARRGIR